MYHSFLGQHYCRPFNHSEEFTVHTADIELVCVGLRQPGCMFNSQLCGHLNTTRVQLSVVLHYAHKWLAFLVAVLL